MLSIIGLVGSFGSGCTFIAKKFFEKNGYNYISLSDILRDEYSKKHDDEPTREILQNFGNEIRQSNGIDYLTKIAIKIINDAKYQKVIIDSIRNPYEVNALKSEFVHCYIFGIYAEPETRWNRIKSIYSEDQAKFNIDEKRDKGEEFEYGQRVSDAFLLSDVIIKNNEDIIGENRTYKEMKLKIKKYLKLFAGEKDKLIPTELESIMTVAYAYSLKSSCLKRKVGAVIVDKDANIFSTGYNEVPIFEDSCLGKYDGCYRAYSKNVISKLFGEDNETKSKVMKKVKFLEKCRALHAEENAILNIAKFGSSIAIQGATLYTTTYPCNLCANKIVSIGIKKIVYYEPYPVLEAKTTLCKANVEQTMFEGITHNAYFKVYNEIIL